MQDHIKFSLLPGRCPFTFAYAGHFYVRSLISHAIFIFSCLRSAFFTQLPRSARFLHFYGHTADSRFFTGRFSSPPPFTHLSGGRCLVTQVLLHTIRVAHGHALLLHVYHDATVHMVHTCSIFCLTFLHLPIPPSLFVFDMSSSWTRFRTPSSFTAFRLSHTLLYLSCIAC